MKLWRKWTKWKKKKIPHFSLCKVFHLHLYLFSNFSSTSHDCSEWAKFWESHGSLILQCSFTTMQVIRNLYSKVPISSKWTANDIKEKWICNGAEAKKITTKKRVETGMLSKNKMKEKLEEIAELNKNNIWHDQLTYTCVLLQLVKYFHQLPRGKIVENVTGEASSTI